MIKPLEKLLPSILIQILRGPPIKVRIEFMNHASVSFDGQQTDLVGILKEKDDAVEDGSDPYQGEEIVGWLLFRR